MVYVISKTGQPIMPTEDHRKVRLLLKSGKAKVVRRTPFTIQLFGTSKTYTQAITPALTLAQNTSACLLRRRRKSCLQLNFALATML